MDCAKYQAPDSVSKFLLKKTTWKPIDTTDQKATKTTTYCKVASVLTN